MDKPKLNRNAEKNKIVKSVFFPVHLSGFQRFSSYFGQRKHPISGRASFHNGLDFAAPFGTPVMAWQKGKIVNLSSSGGCGVAIKIRSEKYDHQYCHLQGTIARWEHRKCYLNNSLRICLGDGVKGGQIIATVGSTGYSTGPHLHWSIWKRNQNTPLDPLPFAKESLENTQKIYEQLKTNHEHQIN